MSKRRAPTDEDGQAAVRLLLSGLIEGADIDNVVASVWPLHPDGNTFPGEVFMDVAADALEIAGLTRSEAVAYEGLLSSYLPEWTFRGRENRKIRFAILTSAAFRGGLEPDLLDEVVWWQTDDYWKYALLAAVALIRATADRKGVSVSEFAQQLARHRGLNLSPHASPLPAEPGKRNQAQAD